MKVLVAPLNWGLGHASRCVPLIERFLSAGDEVVLGGDGGSLTLLRKRFPDLRVVALAPLCLRYAERNSQTWAMVKALPRIVRSAVSDHRLLRKRLAEERFDLVVSDNRFGLFAKNTRCVYVTHQLHIKFPRIHRWLEPAAAALHGWVCRQFDEVWVPDYADGKCCLSGELGHPRKMYCRNVRYIGPLSRFADKEWQSGEGETEYDVVAVLSGLEPHRSLLEEEVLARYAGTEERVLVVEGRMEKPMVRVQYGKITIVPYLDDARLAGALLGAKKIIARSGYSTIMDLAALGILRKATLLPTPGQPEQMYLANFLKPQV